jgi:hypothetical protein
MGAYFCNLLIGWELRDSPSHQKIGITEYWNDGVRGGKTLNPYLSLSIPTNPFFHYSIIPRGHGCSAATEETAGIFFLDRGLFFSYNNFN